MAYRTLPRLMELELDGRESDDCPAVRHRHSRDGYQIDGCRCPSTCAAYARSMDLRNQRRKARRHAQAAAEGRAMRTRNPSRRESPDCPATVHRPTRWCYSKDGCRCPSTVLAYHTYLEEKRRASIAAGRTPNDKDPLDLVRADWLDADAIVQGYRLGVRVDKHTRALAVAMMLRANPEVTDRQIGWRLTNAGQGRWVARDGRPAAYEPVSMRLVQRIVADLVKLPECKDIKAMDRSGRTGEDDDDQ